MPLARFAPPGSLDDLKTDEEKSGWSDLIHRFFTNEITSVEGCVEKASVQFVDPLKRDLGNDPHVVSWPAFPISLLAQGLSRAEALRTADDPTQGRAKQDEYLEWFLHRDADGEITAIDFTCEGPEYWDFLARELPRADFIELYKRVARLTASAAELEKALFPGGQYDPENPFNTSKGIVHLIHPSNTLGAEIDIVAQSTMRRAKNGQPTSQVVSCRRCHSGDAIGAKERKSDPTIASNVNQLARDGRAITIVDPVGLYISKLDTAGWQTPDGSDPQSLFKITRGTPGVRARFEVPDKKFKISDVKIGGEPIRFAGQVAERVFIQVTVLAGPKNEFGHVPDVACTGATHAAPVPAHVDALASRSRS
jgi:hypothetical protein